jgi:F-type H+-transporting ATPase subunit b
METSGIRFRRRWSPRKTVILLALAALLTLGFGGPALGAADGGHGEGDHGGGAKGWVATDTYRVMNFGVLAIALFFLLRKPVSKALNARIEGIKEELADLEGRKQKAEKELADYERKLSSLDQEAQKIVAEYERQGEEARKRILAEAEQAADKLQQQAQRNIAFEYKQAKARLQAEVLDEALSKAEALIRSSVTGDDQERLVDEYLEKVVA